MDLTTLIYQHVMAALLATSGASAVIGWLGRHWRVIGRTWNGAVAVAGWVRRIGPAPETPPDRDAVLEMLEKANLATAALNQAIAVARNLKDSLPKDPVDKPAQEGSLAMAPVHSNLP